MSLFSRSSPNKYGVIIDVGSGSVLAAIVASDQNQPEPEIVWFKREYVPLKSNSSLKNTAKSVMTSLLNVLMLLNKDGKQQLFEKYGRQKLTDLQVSISAPWSYTVTKSITYNKDEEFDLTPDLIAELLRTAHTKIEEELKENEIMHNLGLTIIARTVLATVANGYSIQSLNRQRAKTVMIVESNAIAQNYLLENLNEIKDKVLPESNPQFYSFILLYYYIFRNLFPNTNEACLIDITYEATEVGIVRNGILTYCTHTPFGGASLAREMSEILEVPLAEAMAFLKEPTLDEWLGNFTETKQTEVKKTFAAYADRLKAVFSETGDTLAIPRKIYIHGNLGAEVFFQNIVKNAAEAATKSAHNIYGISEYLPLSTAEKAPAPNQSQPPPDASLFISAQFFHTNELRSRFTQL